MYYIGDYRGQAGWEKFVSEMFHWEVSEIQDNFSSTTLKLVEIYPGLSKLDTINAPDRN